MIQRNLPYKALGQLLRSSFVLADVERDLTILIDLPKTREEDSGTWQDRRRIAAEWYTMARGMAAELPFTALNFCTYPNVGANNGDLPLEVRLADSAPGQGDNLEPDQITDLGVLLQRTSVVLALTEYSATAPLKNLAKKYPFRGATLPGFSRAMIPALGLDYGKVDARVRDIASRLTRAEAAHIVFKAVSTLFELRLDLRHRSAHVSGGLMPEPGVVGNLPSGEAYIVPYEGEIPGDSSQSAGKLPVQFGEEIVVYRIMGNRAVEVLTSGPESEAQSAKLLQEPAYGNLAELGVGVLGEWGVQAVGSTLLDEKLGPHIAFGRSDHFGGITGASKFADASRMVHIDWVYVPSVQPDVTVTSLDLIYPDGSSERLIKDGTVAV